MVDDQQRQPTQEEQVTKTPPPARPRRAPLLLTPVHTPLKHQQPATLQRVLRRSRAAATRSDGAASTAGSGGTKRTSTTATAADDEDDGDEYVDVGPSKRGKKRETLPDIVKRIPVEALRPHLRMSLVSAAKVTCLFVVECS